MRYKSANDCTFREMVERFDSEINRAIHFDWPTDLLTQFVDNKAAFVMKYGRMQPKEAIHDYENRILRNDQDGGDDGQAA